MIEGEYPSLVKRYLSSLIDAGALLVTMLLSALVFHTENEIVVAIRVFLVLFLYFNYEPIMTSKHCTLGQKLTGIRVRNYANRGERINVLRAYIRLFIKLLLGWLSFFGMAFSKERRAVHDYAAKSIVIDAKDTKY